MGTTSLFPTGGGTDHGTLLGLSDDDHLQYALLGGRAGGQTLNGGTAAGDSLTLSASTDAGGGLVETSHPIRSNYTEGNTTPAEQTGFGIWEPTFTTAGAYLGQMIRNDATITYTNSFYIYASILDRSEHISNAATGFQAFTLFNALPLIRNGTSNDLVQMLVLNDGGVHERSTSGTSTAAQHITVSCAPQIRALVTGAVMTWTTGACGLVFAPKFSTAAGSTVNMATLAAVQSVAPTNALFQPNLGTENIDNIYGLWFRAHTNTVAGEISAVRSEMAAASNRYFLRNAGTARSSFGSSNIEFNDLFGPVFGTSQDSSIGWAGASNELFFNFVTPVASQFRIGAVTASNTADRFLFQGDAQDYEFNFNCNRFSLGAQSGAIGNGVGAFVTPARSTAVAGGWADFNLTHSGNLTIDHAMTQVIAWNINPVSLTSGTGSITGYVACLEVGQTNSGLGGAPTHALRQNGRRTGRGVDAFEELSPAQLTADVNDYAPATGSAMRQWWRLTSDASRTITGVAVQQANDTQWITNVGSNPIVLAHQNVGSAAGNRIISPTGANLTIAADESALLIHDSVTDRWRILYHTGT